MSLKLAVIDMDETLLRKDKTYDKKRFDKIVESFADLGLTLCIASGNAVKEIKDYLSEYALEKIYLAGDNGNDIELAGEHIQTNYIDFDALKKVSQLVDKDDGLQMVVNTPLHAYSKYIYEKDRDFIDLFYKEIFMVDSYEEIPDGEKPLKGAILSQKPLDETKEFVKKINEEIKGLASVTSGEGWFDVYNEKGGKGPAVQWLQEEKNISPAETIAFGDSLNDSGMMAHSNYSVAMKNSDDELKDICHYEIGSNEEQSVITVLEEFLENSDMNFMEKYEK